MPTIDATSMPREIVGGPWNWPENYRRRATRLGLMASPSAHRSDLDDAARDPLMTVERAGEYLGTGTRFIRRLITERRISFVKVGKYVRLERSALDAFVDAGRVPSHW